MGDFVLACKADEVSEGRMKEVAVQDRVVLIANVGGKYYAVAGKCPHLGGRLAQGKLEGSVVTCPKHGSRFDVTDGHVVRWLKQSGVLSKVGSMVRPERPLMVYKTRVEGGEIMVEI